MDKTSGNEKNESIDWGLLQRKIQGMPLDDEEESQLEHWLQTSPEHKAYLKKAISEWSSPIPQPRNDFSELEHNLFKSSGILPTEANQHRKMIAKFSGKRRWITIAASLLVFAGLTVWVIESMRRGSSFGVHEDITLAEAGDSVIPGAPHARLILASGKSINLEEPTSISGIKNSKGNLISVADGMVSFSEVEAGDKKNVSYNTLEVPRGGEFTLRLADGSTIWLNSKSTIRFPEHFNAESRKVYLEGEAYFEICNDRKRNFIVSTPVSEVEVYGTSFNLRSYPNEKEQQTTLVAGKIGIKTNGKEVTLRPGQQAVITKGSDIINVEEVDTTLYCSWRKGLFIFEYRRLEDILSQLSDWYDVDFTYTDPSLKELHFTGDLERYADFNEILSLIGMTTNISFEIKGKHVFVKKSKTNPFFNE